MQQKLKLNLENLQVYCKINELRKVNKIMFEKSLVYVAANR